MPGSIPATSQLDWLSSMTAMIVLFWSTAPRDLLKSFGWGIAGTPSIRYSDEVAISRRPPHSIYRFPVAIDQVTEWPGWCSPTRSFYGLHPVLNGSMELPCCRRCSAVAERVAVAV